ncbi:hypothetical protein GUJ93_ZPchr0007g4501 [Zizania palustris]|uniref:Uncharacterized protein n=1 Tax=Zizania palustris TaxID=103762 RepID=A0A8J5TF82_ZIZPA|nr:hypothetical protein GUJ93_ZPchr0007g4501 [Zizania palustris]
MQLQPFDACTTVAPCKPDLGGHTKVARHKILQTKLNRDLQGSGLVEQNNPGILNANYICLALAEGI